MFISPCGGIWETSTGQTRDSSLIVTRYLKSRFRPHQIPHCVDTFLTPSPGAWLWAPACLGPARECAAPAQTALPGRGQARKSPRLLPAQAATLSSRRPNCGTAPAATGNPSPVPLSGATGPCTKRAPGPAAAPGCRSRSAPACSREHGRLRRPCAHTLPTVYSS